MQNINTALSQGDCDRAQRNYNVWKDFAKTSDPSVERRIAECRGDGTGGANQSFTVNGVTFEMIFVQGGTFSMGCTAEQGSDCNNREKPAHSVTVGNFSIGKFEVTQALWKAVMGSNPSSFKGDNLPVENVSWDDAQEFCRKLSAATGKQFRLPSEAEWEYSARGGARSKGFIYSGGNNLNIVGWFWDNSGKRTQSVGQKQANELGIYDMSGNVWEWCSDWYGVYTATPKRDPMGASSGSDRVIRGSSWIGAATGARVASRYDSTPGNRSSNFGFRLACSSN